MRDSACFRSPLDTVSSGCSRVVKVRLIAISAVFCKGLTMNRQMNGVATRDRKNEFARINMYELETGRCGRRNMTPVSMAEMTKSRKMKMVNGLDSGRIGVADVCMSSPSVQEG